MNNRKICAAAMVLMMMLGAGCSVNNNESASDKAAAQQEQSVDTSTSQDGESTNDPASSDEDSSPDEAPDNSASVTLNGSSAEISEGAQGISVSGSVVTITAAGDYTFTGTLDDGQILVNAPKTDKVDIYLDNVTISNSATAPIRVEAADGVTLHLVEGSVNRFTDSASNNVSACISAKDDLTIKGKGTLQVIGNGKHAIKSSNDVKIKNGIYEIASVAAGIYGEDSVQLTGGTITITTCKDGIKSVNDTDTERGTVSCEDAVVDIQNASGNGIEASKEVAVLSGSIKIHSVKQAINCDVQTVAEGAVTVY